MEAEQPATIGIEEEYFLVDRQTRDLCLDPPAELMDRCRERLGDHVTSEFMRSQIEIGTPVCADMAEARAALALYRRTIAEIAADYDLAPIAASTHPFGQWDEQLTTAKARYTEIADKYRGVVRRQLISGMHVHLAVPDADLRIDLHSQLAYFLPHLLALSCSSPFWRGGDTGLKSYRTVVIHELPRAGLPHTFDSYGEYRRYVDMLVSTGMIEDSSKIWWDLRLSENFPTLEMRITDTCTRLEDALAIAATYQCLASMLVRLKRRNQRWRSYSMALIAENRWLAQRHGTGGRLLDFGRGEAVDFAILADEIIDLVAEDAERLGCAGELLRIRDIARTGTSADRQLAVHGRTLAAGGSEDEALAAVVDHLVAETQEGCAA